MKRLARHTLLAHGSTYEECKAQVLNFFEKTTLVQYDRVTIDEKNVLHGDHTRFPEQLDQCLQKNRAVLDKFITDLKSTGFSSFAELPNLEQGYPSKLLHIIAHFLDGFIGIDTVFYSLIDDSHWVSSQTREQMAADPGQYWLIPLDGYSMTPREAALLHM